MAELRFIKEAQRIENTLYFTGSAQPDSVLAGQLATALVTWWTNNIRLFVSSDMTLTEVFITDISSQEGFTLSHVVSPPLAGTAIGESLPSNVALCISFRTAFRGRSGRGRNYVAGCTEANCAGSFFSTAYVNAMVSAYGLLMGAGNFVPGLGWTIVTRHFNGQPRPIGLSRTVTAVLSVNNSCDSQRRRLPGRGR